MPMERYQFMSNVWKDGIFGKSKILDDGFCEDNNPKTPL
jgi:hypothetical protein